MEYWALLEDPEDTCVEVEESCPECSYPFLSIGPIIPALRRQLS
jgi:hypothetical protein